MLIAGKGVRDWKLQHLAAVVITAYLFCILGFVFIEHPDLSAWKVFFALPAMKVFTLVTLLQVMIHRWIGMWAVLTDYIKVPFCFDIPFFKFFRFIFQHIFRVNLAKHVKIYSFRLFLEGAMMIALMAYFFWGVIIVLGVNV